MQLALKHKREIIMSKYRSVKTIIDHFTFDSKKEAAYYQHLKLRLLAHEICDLALQPEYPIEINGLKICKVKLDFRYVEKATGKIVVVDVKGMDTPFTRSTPPASTISGKGTDMTDFKAISRISAWEKFKGVTGELILAICQAYDKEKEVSKVTMPSEKCQVCGGDKIMVQPMGKLPYPMCATCGRNHPSAFAKQEGGDHYRGMKNQPFAFVRDNNVGHAEGEAIYRLLRWRDKGGIADLKKVIHTVELIIEYETNQIEDGGSK